MNILNFGSLNIDYVYSVEHFIRPGETMATKGREIFPGGKGLNQSIAIARTLEKNDTIKIYHAGCIGKSDGKFLKELLKENNIHTDFIAEHKQPSGHTVIQVDSHGQNCILLYTGANFLQNKTHIDTVLSHFSSNDFLILQNEINNLDYIIRQAHTKGMTIFFNPSPFDSAIAELPLAYIDYFLLNEIECAELSGIASQNTPAALELLHTKFPYAKIVLTLGAKGVIYSDGKSVLRHGIYDVPVVDTTAAGDCFTGYFIGCLAQNMPLTDTLRFASKASSLAVSKKGAASSIPLFSQVSSSNLRYISDSIN